MALPAVSGAASGMAGTPLGSDLITLSNGLSLADIGDVFGAVQWDFGEGKVSEFSVPAVDLDGVLSKRGLLKAGVRLTYQGERWEVAAVEREYKGENTWLTFTARSQLARRLRTMTGPDRQTDVSPAQWITSRVRKAGGVAVVEPGAKRRTVVQKRNQSVLSVIEALASDMGVSWVEFDGRVFVGTPWWAFQGKTNLPTWQASARGAGLLGNRVLDAVGFSARSSLDDRTNASTADLLVTANSGIRLRPWHRVEVIDADPDDRGLWLVSNVAFGEGKPDVSVSLTRPLKASPKKGSQGASGGGIEPVGEPIAGSSYSDAPRPAGWKGRTVEQILGLYNANRGGLYGHRINNGCLWYAQEVAGYAHEGPEGPKQLWPNLGGRRRTTKSIVPGAVVFYASSNYYGHAVVYLGGGRVLSTDANTQGGFAAGQWSICPADALDKWGPFMGWYVP